MLSFYNTKQPKVFITFIGEEIEVTLGVHCYAFKGRTLDKSDVIFKKFSKHKAWQVLPGLVSNSGKVKGANLEPCISCSPITHT